MNYFKKRSLLMVFISFYSFASNEVLDTYEIELLIFKNKSSESSEVFNSVFSPPTGNFLAFRDVDFYMNNKSFTIKETNSFFKNIFSQILINDRSAKGVIKKVDSERISNPKEWFRKTNKVNILSKIENKIKNSEEFTHLESISWKQNIPLLDESSYLKYTNINSEFGFYINLYRNRYLHADMKAYLGLIDSNEQDDNIFVEKYIKESDKKIMDSKKDSILQNINLLLNDKNDLVKIKNNQNIDQIKGLTINSSVINYFIEEDRRIFDNEIHYFDHPMFGVVISINKVN